MNVLAYALAIAAIALMALDLVQAFRLKAALAHGEMARGEVARKWGLLTGLLVFFFVGYLASPLLLLLQVPGQFLYPLVFLVFLLGAAFVLIVVGILRDVLKVLDLLK